MSEDRVQKVKPGHLRRDAYVYVRQSTLRQVVENTESTRRQYDLQERAVALGWPRERIVVIDDDLGQSAVSGDRGGFERLRGDVRRGLAGIVMSLEVSRLARRTSEAYEIMASATWAQVTQGRRTLASILHFETKALSSSKTSNKLCGEQSFILACKPSAEPTP